MRPPYGDQIRPPWTVPGLSRISGMQEHQPLLEKIGVPCPKCGKEVVLKKTKKGRKYYGCENNPECDFMSWQKPTREHCPECGTYMLEKGNKLVCANESCGYVAEKPEKKEHTGVED